MIKRLTFGDVEAALEQFGYVQRKKSNHQIFEHPKGSLMIVLPKIHSSSEVSPTHLKIVEKTIRDDQVVNWDDFDFYLQHGKRREDFIKRGDRLIWTVPQTGQEIKVVAASGEEDRMVIIKQKDTFSPCPVSQLRKEEVVERIEQPGYRKRPGDRQTAEG
jgi:predicted RNA binding protein YcfA (HicA-like mRNA interferase family)